MTITVAVVGCGRWGSVHLASLAEMKSSGQVDRVIACDVDEVVLNNVIHADATYSSVDEMVGAEQPNLAIVATPNPTHYPLGMALLKNGLNLLIGYVPITLSPLVFDTLSDVSIRISASWVSM